MTIRLSWETAVSLKKINCPCSAFLSFGFSSVIHFVIHLQNNLNWCTASLTPFLCTCLCYLFQCDTQNLRTCRSHWKSTSNTESGDTTQFASAEKFPLDVNEIPSVVLCCSQPLSTNRSSYTTTVFKNKENVFLSSKVFFLSNVHVLSKLIHCFVCISFVVY